MNVLVMFCDQLRRDLLGCYGGGLVRTPHLDALAADSVVFDRCYTPIAICSPARASLMTGQYPHGHHMYTNSTPPYSYCRHLRPDVPMVQQWARRDAGATTAYYGKWHIGPVDDLAAAGFDYTHLPPTWPEPSAAAADVAAPLPFLSDTQWHPLPQWAPLVASAGPSTGTFALPMERFPDVVAASHTIDFLRERAAAAEQPPFLAFCAFPGPHGPWLVPEEFGRRYEAKDIPPWPNRDDSLAGKPLNQRKLQHMEFSEGGITYPRLTAAQEAERLTYNFSYIELIDEQVGRVVAELKRSGLYDDTLLVFTADHGDMAGSHGFVSKGGYMYDEIYRIPLLIRVPGVASGRREREPVTLTDLTATVAHALVEGAGSDPPPRSLAEGDRAAAEPLHGESLLPALRGEGAWERSVAYCEYHGDWYGHYSSRMVADGDWKLVWNLTDLCELYDLNEDPHELTNLFYSDASAASDASGADASGAGSSDLAEVRERYFELLLAEAARTHDGQLELRQAELDFDPRRGGIG